MKTLPLILHVTKQRPGKPKSWLKAWLGQTLIFSRGGSAVHQFFQLGVTWRYQPRWSWLFRWKWGPLGILSGTWGFEYHGRALRQCTGMLSFTNWLLSLPNPAHWFPSEKIYFDTPWHCYSVVGGTQGFLSARLSCKGTEHWQRTGGKGRRFRGFMMQPVTKSLTWSHLRMPISSGMAQRCLSSSMAQKIPLADKPWVVPVLPYFHQLKLLQPFHPSSLV